MAPMHAGEVCAKILLVQSSGKPTRICVEAGARRVFDGAGGFSGRKWSSSVCSSTHSEQVQGQPAWCSSLSEGQLQMHCVIALRPLTLSLGWAGSVDRERDRLENGRT